MGNNSVPKFIFRLSRFPVYRGSVLGRFYCISLFSMRVLLLKTPRISSQPGLNFSLSTNNSYFPVRGCMELAKLLNRKFSPRCRWPLVRTKHLWTHINFQLGNLQEDKTFSLWLTSLPRLVFQLSTIYLVLIKMQVRIRYGRSVLARSGRSHKDS